MYLNYYTQPVDDVIYDPNLTPSQDTILELIREFNPIFEQRPFNNVGGISYWGALTYYYFLKDLGVDFVVESGVWRGFSSWVVQLALKPRIHVCLDPVFMMPIKFEREYRPPQGILSTHDYSCLSLDKNMTQNGVSILDDHQNCVPRLTQTINYGFRYILMDDNLRAETDHLTLEHQLMKPTPKLGWTCFIEKYILFPPPLPGVPNCPLNPVFESLPQELSHLDPNTDLSFSWITFLYLKCP